MMMVDDETDEDDDNDIHGGPLGISPGWPGGPPGGPRGPWESIPEPHMFFFPPFFGLKYKPCKMAQN